MAANSGEVAMILVYLFALILAILVFLSVSGPGSNTRRPA
jgi:hypothetical protein